MTSSGKLQDQKINIPTNLLNTPNMARRRPTFAERIVNLQIEKMSRSSDSKPIVVNQMIPLEGNQKDTSLGAGLGDLGLGGTSHVGVKLKGASLESSRTNREEILPKRQCLQTSPSHFEQPAPLVAPSSMSIEKRSRIDAGTDLFIYDGPYHSSGDRAAAVAGALAAWTDASKEPSTDGWVNPRKGVVDSIGHIHKGYVGLTLACQRMSIELDYVHKNSVPKKNHEQLQNRHFEASHSLRRAQRYTSSLDAKIETYQSQLSTSESKIRELEKDLADAKSKLNDAKFLSAKFKETVECCDLEDLAMSSGVAWSIETAKARYPQFDFEFLNTKFKELCDGSRNDKLF